MWLYRCSGPSTNNNGSPLFQYDITKLSSLKLKVAKQYHDCGVYNSHSKLFKHMFFYSKTILLEDQTPSNPDVSWFSIVQPLIFQGSFTTPPATPAFFGRPHDDFPRQGIGHGAPLAETLEEVQPQARQMPRQPLDCWDVYLMYIWCISDDILATYTRYIKIWHLLIYIIHL